MGANYSFEVKNIDIWAPTFFNHNNSYIATVAWVVHGIQSELITNPEVQISLERINKKNQNSWLHSIPWNTHSKKNHSLWKIIRMSSSWNPIGSRTFLFISWTMEVDRNWNEFRNRFLWKKRNEKKSELVIGSCELLSIS